MKEHFEVNVVPIRIQMTFQFYKTVMGFFFPDKNIETEGQGTKVYEIGNCQIMIADVLEESNDRKYFNVKLILCRQKLMEG